MRTKVNRRGRGEGTIQQRTNGTWYAVAVVGHDGLKAIRKTVSAATRQEVAERLAELLSDKNKGAVSLAPVNLTVGQFLTDWLESTAKRNVRASTFYLYQTMVRRHIAPYLGRLPLVKLHATHVNAWLGELSQKKAFGDNRLLSPRNRQMAYTILRQALNEAARFDLIKSNPCGKVDKPTYKSGEMRVLTAEQTLAFLDAAAADRLYALYALALGKGLRQGELFGLQWSDLDRKAKTLSIRRTIVDMAGTITISEPKTKQSRRTIRLSQREVDGLWEHKARQLADGQADSPWIFTDTDGNHLRRSNLLQRSFVPILTAAGLPVIRFHDLRHTALSAMLAAGVPVKTVQEIAGHTLASTTLDVYGHLLPGAQEAACDTMEAYYAAAARKRAY